MDEWYSSDGASQGTSIWSLYVGLFLVLLTFFIMLAGFSRPDSARTSAVVDSLQATFGTQPVSLRDDEGLFAPGSSALAELGGDLAGLLRVAHVQRAARGEELRVTLPESELFPPDSAEVRDTSMPAIDRVVAALSMPPNGVRLEVAVSLGVQGAVDTSRGQDGDEVALAIRRAGALARALVSRGAAPAAIAIGIDSRQPGRALLAFRSSGVDQTLHVPADERRER
jgi:outer membrane protein OmpA-like peptidoglycan-associated protein